MYQGCESYEKAVELYTEAYHDGGIQVMPKLGGRFDTRVVVVIDSSESDQDELGQSDDGGDD